MVALVVHGGAWDIPQELIAGHKDGLKHALRSAWEILSGGNHAVDAVEAAIRAMENDEMFDAGRGSFMNAAGEIELDASIMDGTKFRAGAVASVQGIPNPIVLARKIMEKSEHVILSGLGAVRFAKEQGVPTCGPDDLIVEREITRWREHQSGKKSTKDSFQRKSVRSDTVGAVAIDKKGNIASGTSTGGTPNKYPGRIGDSPLIGIGTYADSKIGGVSTTGWGEGMIKVVMAKTVIDEIERNNGDSEKATQYGISILEKKVKGYGGLIALSSYGNIGIAFNTPRMARGFMTSDMKSPRIEV